MVAWPDKFGTSRQKPGREQTKFDQEKALEFDDHVSNLIEEFNEKGVKWLLRKLQSYVGDEAEDILYQGLEAFWKNRSCLSLDATVVDVERLMTTICMNLVKAQYRRKKIITWLPLSWEIKNQDGDVVEKERVYLDGLEDEVCRQMLCRDVMAEILRHFPKEEDRQCIEFMMLGMKPREIAACLPGSAGQYGKRCERLRKRMRAILAEMAKRGVLGEEFNLDGR